MRCRSFQDFRRSTYIFVEPACAFLNRFLLRLYTTRPSLDFLCLFLLQPLLQLLLLFKLLDHRLKVARELGSGQPVQASGHYDTHFDDKK